MAASDAILIGEDWISEHFFTTDATSQSFQALVVERRKQWEAEKDGGTPRTRFTAERRWLLTSLAALGDTSSGGTAASSQQRVEEISLRLLNVLGYDALGLRTERSGPVTRVFAPGSTQGSPLAIVHAAAANSIDALLVKDASTLSEPLVTDDGMHLTSVARALSALFVTEDAPDFALVLAGQFLMVAERSRWAEGRYLGLDLQLVCERADDRRGGEVDRLLTCVGAQSLAPDASGDVWWSGVLEQSVKHTVGVSKDLREGVRLSIEIIANEVVERRARLGLPPLPAEQAQVLAKQSLRFLYRVLFLLYAEASPELGVLPAGAPEYERGYSLDRLRELTLVELTTDTSRAGGHLYESLGVLFHLVDNGHDPAASAAEHNDGLREGLTFRSLRADLFAHPATALIDEVGLGNAAVQRVLGHLLLSKQIKGRDRGFISYAELGINQLGAVYEGLMSYTGSFAETDLYEVAKNGDASKGSWVVPMARAEGLSSADFVRETDPVTGEATPVIHRRGTFVFRLAGRERQQSASFYTPEVLTRFVVSQALEELLDQNGATTTAAGVLELTVCEPALGSGAFAIEAVRQLAEQYLRRRQDELGQRIDPDAYPRELQRVKASIALHQVYGVDLNATAVELAEISLWLDTMVEGLEAPWFGLHLRRGNSLIGARRATFRRDQVAKNTHVAAIPQDAPMTTLATDVAAGRLAHGIGGTVHHFLLPAAGWGSAVDAKEAKALAPEALQRLKAWRKSVQVKPTADQVKDLIDLGYRVEALWQISWQRLTIAEQEVRRSIPLWGAEAPAHSGAVSREKIETALADASGAYQRLRRVMDAWCALWFWPLTDTLTTTTVAGLTHRIEPPTLVQWIEGLQMLLGRHAGKAHGTTDHERLGTGMSWEELGAREDLDLGFASASPISSTLAQHPWLRVCEQIAAQQGFFHWDLDFAAVFTRGGFDLQVGNPPWVRPRSDVDALLAEGDPWWQLEVKPSEGRRAEKRRETLTLPGMTEVVVDGTADVAVVAAFVGDVQHYPHLAGLQPDLYRCFMEQGWRHTSAAGMIGLIHLESHFTDEKAGLLRSGTYRRLRRHWQFINELQLFEIQNQKTYGVNVYGAIRDQVSFQHAASLYHPDTAVRSLMHDGSGPEPSIKTEDGAWDVTAHRGRVVTVTDDVLTTWHAVLEDPEVPTQRTRMVYSVNRACARVLDQVSAAGRLGSLELHFSRGWDESIDRKKGFFETSWGEAPSWDDVILQGSHIFVSSAFYKSPNKTLLHNTDWSPEDLESIAVATLPITAYKPAGDRYRYDVAYTDWGDTENPNPARDYYRIAWRRMAANTGERTLIPAIIPPGAAHVHAASSFGAPTKPLTLLALAQGYTSSLLSDLCIRSKMKSDIPSGAISHLPYAPDFALAPLIAQRVLRLNCLTSAYAQLWAACHRLDFAADRWTTTPLGATTGLGCSTPVWDAHVPLRRAAERRQAQVEVDTLVALSLGVSADELCTVYRTQFPVLYGYDRRTRFYDTHGRLVPNSVLTAWRQRGERITHDERTAENPSGNVYTYELPFVTLDREADMRVAYAHFEQMLKDQA